MVKSRSFRLAAGQTHPAADLAPDAPFWAVGDVHGRADLLAPLLTRLIATGEQVVLLGDYINRGGDSAEALRLVHQAGQAGQITALRGNHEDLLVRFLARPRIAARQFVRYGGNATLRAFGVAPLDDTASPRDISACRNALAAAMGPLADWLQQLPWMYLSGNVAALHAGADPAQPVAAQFPPSLAWGHHRFTKDPRTDGLWVAHGHHRVAQVTVKDRRIAVDTGAYETGILSAVRIAAGSITVA